MGHITRFATGLFSLVAFSTAARAQDAVLDRGDTAWVLVATCL